MPKKLTIEDVKNYLIENDINNECTLISDTYINSSTKLDFQCNICGQNFQKDFSHLKSRGVFCCPTCSKKRASQSKITIDFIRDYIKSNDVNNYCTLLSTNYINSTTPLEFKCNVCGKNFKRDWAHLRRGRFRCEKCGIYAGATSLKYTVEDVKEKLSEREYELIGNYVNASTPVQVKCKNGHLFDLIFTHFLNGHSGCKQCANDNLKGENNYNWKGGLTEITEYLRKATYDWRREVYTSKGYNCEISNSNKDLVIHHLVGFNTLVEKASLETGVPLLQHIGGYKREDLEKLKNRLVELHTIDIGVVLNKDIHSQFHKSYGKGNNTPEQFIEFKTNFRVSASHAHP